MGQVNDFVEIPDCGGELKIGFNHKFLHDALKAAERESIIMEFNTALCPLYVSVEGDSFLLWYCRLGLQAKGWGRWKLQLIQNILP